VLHLEDDRVRSDLDILLVLADLAEKYLPELRQYRPRATAAEFQRLLLRELDFGREERHLQQFAANFAGDPGVRFPEPHPEYSTNRVLTMELFEGVKLSECVRLRELGYDLEELARRGARVFLDMIFRDGFYHADPHPGNLVVLPGGVVGMLDCGMVGRLDERMREDIEDLLMAIIERDAGRVALLITRVGAVPPNVDVAGLEADVGDFLGYYSSQPLDQLDLSAALTEMTEIVRRYHIVLPTGIALLLKVLVMLEGTSRLLNPCFNLTDLMRPYQKKLLLRRLSPRRQLLKYRRLYREWEYLGEVLPRGVADILQQVRSGRFDVHLAHKHLEPSVNRLVFGLLTSSLFLGSALLWSLNVPPQLGGVSVLGVAGCCCSFVLGLRLLWAIRRSGRLDE
jgi:ubiquinone biosynthesis protein